jgi:hypothetical protein
MKAKALMIAGLCGLVAALALPASGVAAAPPTVIHWHFTTPPFPDDFEGCGIDGTSVMTGTGVLQIDASGAGVGFGEVSGTFTSSASGKSILFQTAELEKTSAPIDNGDGTFSFILHGAGMTQKLSAPNGPTLALFAGERDLLITLDAQTFDLVSMQVLHTGGSHGIADCDVIVSALT